MKFLLVSIILLSPLQAAPRKIKFQGVVKEGERFQKTITRKLQFTLDPERGGWTIEVEPAKKEKLGEEACTYFASTATPPFHFENPRYIWPGYSDVKDVVQITRREFFFVTTVDDCERVADAAEILSHPTTNTEAEFIKAGTQFTLKPFGRGVLTILDAEIETCDDCGEPENPRPEQAIKWMRFEVEITLPDVRK